MARLNIDTNLIPGLKVGTCTRIVRSKPTLSPILFARFYFKKTGTTNLRARNTLSVKCRKWFIEEAFFFSLAYSTLPERLLGDNPIDHYHP